MALNKYIIGILLISISLFFTCSERESILTESFPSAPILSFNKFMEVTSKTSSIKAGKITIVQDTLYYHDFDKDLVSINISTSDASLKVYTDKANSSNSLNIDVSRLGGSGSIILSIDVSNLTSLGSVQIVGEDKSGLKKTLTRSIDIANNVAPIIEFSFKKVETTTISNIYEFDLSGSRDGDASLGGEIVKYGLIINLSGQEVVYDFPIFRRAFTSRSSFMVRGFVEDDDGARIQSEEKLINP